MTTTSFALAIISTILGVAAIAVSFHLFQQSQYATRQITEATNRINSSVDQMQVLVNHLSAESWELIKDTMADFRRNLWSAPTIDSPKVTQGSDKHLTLPTQGVNNEVESNQRTGEARRVESDREQVQGYLMDAYKRLRKSGQIVTAGQLTSIARQVGYEEQEAISALFDLVLHKHALFADGELRSNAVLADSSDEAKTLKKQLLNSKLDDLLPE